MPRVTGRVSASFTDVNGVTRLGDRYHSYPLKIAKAFPFDEGQLGVYLMDASPGIMSGDAYELDWRFGQNTKVYVTNQSYTKVHPRFRDAEGQGLHEPSRQTQKLHLMEGSYVEYMPEPLMLYKDACFNSLTEVRMEKSSTLIASEMVCPGRTHRGELFEYEQYKNEFHVYYDDEWIFCGRQRIQPSVQSLKGIGSWGNYTHYGTLYVFSEEADASFAEALLEYLDQITGLAAPAPRMSSLFYGVSRSCRLGVLVSVLGFKGYEVQEFLEKAWRFSRSRIFSAEPLVIRK
ncbi:hypothetical protein GCM10023310_07710 [Paenibacillus vulneris]|uniref:Urease accessory protein UreD n=1 Tax=Paenibacillus vulneris TaxID=1133364 RepID=A0ABW3UMD3_9BACL|nr:urease accessory protein UreD [Paenibacillus sp. 32352]